MGWQWHQLDHMQISCISLQTYNHSSTSSLNFFTGRMLFLMPNHHCHENFTQLTAKASFKHTFLEYYPLTLETEYIVLILYL